MNNQFIILLIQFFFLSWLNAEPLVKITQGKLSGIYQRSRSGRKFSAFLGIPYAQPPIGNLRFRSPVAAKKWDGIRSADETGNMCLQAVFSLIMGNEDCLYLNVYTPLVEFDSSLENHNDNNTLLPVMVWFHGGAFILGSGDTYGAEYLLDKDVLLVTLNYRLGILGFLSTGDSVAPGNFGMKDQVFALKWVQENIKKFGGDPNRVTIFGQSAGAASVSLHALSTATNGLYHQYITESGSALCFWAFQERSKIVHAVKKMSPLLFCPSDSSENLVNCLRKKNARFLIFWSQLISTITNPAKLLWTPTDEPYSDDAYLIDSPKNLIEKNQMKDLTFISGMNTDEGLFFTSIFYMFDMAYTTIKNTSKFILDIIAGNFFDDFDKKTYLSNAINEFYFNNSLLSADKMKVLGSFTKLLTDGLYIYPEQRLMEKITTKMNKSHYRYCFGYRGTFNVLPILFNNKKDFGVGHTDEILYLFPVTFGPFKSSKFKMTASDLFISKLLVELWTSFATNGKPTSEEFKEPDFWKPYNIQNNTHLHIGHINNNSDPTVTLSNYMDLNSMNFWRENYPM